MAVCTRVRRSSGRVPGVEEIFPLRVSVLRIAVRQAHTSKCLDPAVPDAELSVGLGVGLGRRRPRRRCETGTEVRETELERRKRAAWPLSISGSPDAPADGDRLRHLLPPPVPTLR